MKRVWLVHEGMHYGEGFLSEPAYATKKAAVQALRAEGYKWCSEDEIFTDDSRFMWACVEPMEVKHG